MTLRISWISISVVVCLAALVGGGCQHHRSSSPTQKQQAAEEWNDARARVLQSLAKDQFQTGNFDKARQTINDALKLDPKNASARVLSAHLAIEQGQLELAERELKLAREADPKNGEADYLLGVVYQRWQRLDEALAAYQSAADKQP